MWPPGLVFYFLLFLFHIAFGFLLYFLEEFLSFIFQFIKFLLSCFWICLKLIFLQKFWFYTIRLLFQGWNIFSCILEDTNQPWFFFFLISLLFSCCFHDVGLSWSGSFTSGFSSHVVNLDHMLIRVICGRGLSTVNFTLEWSGWVVSLGNSSSVSLWLASWAGQIPRGLFQSHTWRTKAWLPVCSNIIKWMID